MGQYNRTAFAAGAYLPFRWSKPHPYKVPSLRQRPTTKQRVWENSSLSNTAPPSIREPQPPPQAPGPEVEEHTQIPMKTESECKRVDYPKQFTNRNDTPTHTHTHVHTLLLPQYGPGVNLMSDASFKKSVIWLFKKFSHLMRQIAYPATELTEIVSRDWLLDILKKRVHYFSTTLFRLRLYFG